jgi:hypothetical protein
MVDKEFTHPVLGQLAVVAEVLELLVKALNQKVHQVLLHLLETEVTV